MVKKGLEFKINFSLLLMSVFVFIACIYCIISINKTQEYAKTTAENWLPSIVALNKLHSTEGGLSRTVLRVLTTKDIEKQKEQIAKVNALISDFEENLAEYEKLVSEPEEKIKYPEIIKAWKEYKEFIPQIIALQTADKTPEAIELASGKPRELIGLIEVNLDKLKTVNFEGAVLSTQKGTYLSTQTTIVMIVLIIADILVFLFAFNIIHKTAKSIEKVIITLRENSLNINSIGKSIENSSVSLSNAVSLQAGAINETSASVNEITSMVNRTSENARESSKIAEHATKKSDEGQQIMQRLTGAMEKIQESNTDLQGIVNVIGQIHSKTAVIHEIVSKTELLSLNASIESARAGEAGKGFAVVAEEVGNLAKVSGKAAIEIQDLITKSQEHVGKVIEHTKARVNEGKSVTTEAHEAFKLIQEDVESMSTMIRQISDATSEQEIGARQIAQSMSQMSQSAESTRVSAEESKISSKEIVKNSDELNGLAKNIDTLFMGNVS